MIENKDFEALIRQYDRPNAFFYCDPPYFETEGHYEEVFRKEDHVRLRDTLAAIEGKFMVSYNDCEHIRELYQDFQIEAVTRINNLAQRYDNGSEFPEVLIANYDSMNLILFCVFLTFAFGLFLLLSGLLRLPTLKTSRVMMDTGKEGKQLSKTLDAFYMDGAVKIAKYIRINDYKKSRMASVLRASGLGMTPEVYTAYAYLKAGSVFLLIIPTLYVFPLAALFVILLGIMIYYKEIQKADEMLKEKREQMGYIFIILQRQELPCFPMHSVIEDYE